MDQRWLRSLIVARQLLAQAERFADGSDSGAVGAVTLADVAVETVAKAAIGFRPPTQLAGSPKQQRDPSFHDVRQSVVASWREAGHEDAAEPVEIGEARQLRHYRNVVQHDAVVPAAGEVDRSLRRAEAFIRWTVTEFFGLQLEDVSRAILLLDDEVRGRVVLAERHAAESDFRLALAHLRVAFEAAIRSQKSWRFNWTFIEHEIKTSVGRATGTEFGRHPANVSTHGLIDVLEKIASRLEDVDEVVQAIAVGADPVEFAWFLRVAPAPGMTFGTNPFWTIHDDEPRSRDEYLRGYEFVVLTLLRWQTLPPPLDRSVRGTLSSETLLENPEAASGVRP